MSLANFRMIPMYCWWQTLHVLNLLHMSVSVQYLISLRLLLVMLSTLPLSDVTVNNKMTLSDVIVNFYRLY